MRIFIMCSLLLLTLQSQAAALPDAPHIVVTGEASVTAKPDQAIIRVAIEAIAKDVVQAKSQVDEKMQNAINSLLKQGIEHADIQAGQLYIHRQSQFNRDSSQAEFIGFKVRRTLSIKLTQLSGYAELLQTLVRQGITEFNGTEFLSSRYNELLQQANQLAIKNAKQAANTLSKDYGVSIKGLYSASYAPLANVIQPAMHGLRSAAENSASYQVGEITIHASSQAVYLID